MKIKEKHIILTQFVLITVLGFYGLIDGLSSTADFLNYKSSLVLTIISIVIWISVNYYSQSRKGKFIDSKVKEDLKSKIPIGRHSIIFTIILLCFWAPLLLKNDKVVEPKDSKQEEDSGLIDGPYEVNHIDTLLRNCCTLDSNNFSVLLLSFTKLNISGEEPYSKLLAQKLAEMEEDGITICYDCQLASVVHSKKRIKDLMDQFDLDMVIYGNYGGLDGKDLVSIDYVLRNFGYSDDHQNSLTQTDIVLFSSGHLQGELYSDLNLILGNKHFENRAFERAISYYDKALSFDSLNSSAYVNAGFSKYHSLGWKEALADYEKAIGVDPDNGIAYNNRGFVNHFHLKNNKAAMRDYLKAIEVEYEYIPAYKNIAHLYELRKEWGKALHYLNEGLTKAAANQRTQFLKARANIYDITGEFNLALADQNEVIIAEPNEPKHYVARGWIYHKLKKYGISTEDLRKALDLNIQPSHSTFYLLAYNYYLQGENRSAIKYISKAISSQRTPTYIALEKSIKKRYQEQQRRGNRIMLAYILCMLTIGFVGYKVIL